MDDLKLRVIKLQEEVAQLLHEKRKLEEWVEELTPKVRFVAFLQSNDKPLYWIAE